MLKFTPLIFIILLIIVLGLLIFGYRIPLVKETKLGEISFRLNMRWQAPTYYEIATKVFGVKIDRSYIKKVESRADLAREIEALKEGEKVFKSGTVTATEMNLSGVLCKKDIEKEMGESCNLPEATDIEKAKELAPNIFYCWQVQNQPENAITAGPITIETIKEYSRGYLVEFPEGTFQINKIFLTKTGCTLPAFTY